MDVAAFSKGKVPFNRGGMAPNSGIRNGDRKNRERKIHTYIYRFPSPGFKMQKGGLCSLVFGFK